MSSPSLMYLCSRCLYLDADVIVQGDLRPPYERYGRADCDYAKTLSASSRREV